ncbi:hypothetical protein tinsulaeT_16200 [Thalassotalea insulae]|uniref:Tail specific protease domain-containing protein n=1 Tax=Thalassotalea insulae TaxID=2056778 RepID=A0ABQ6GUV1_9GAMM|nr:S41 family peptidase [Thalassotalea insulae]GLX78280.1 hypothetical protein tinsulaeT_16200 [Thalassotalea insulae]
MTTIRIFSLFLFTIYLLNIKCALGDNELNKLNKQLSPAKMQQDIDAWREWLSHTHPNLSIRMAKVAAFDQAITTLKASLNTPLTNQEFLAKITRLNSQFNDGHMNIMVNSQSKLTQAILASGQGLFPFEVIVDKGHLYISTELGGNKSEYEKQEITQINGRNATAIYADLLERTYGDTPTHREAILSEKFALYYWLFVSKASKFDIEVNTIQGTKSIQVSASMATPKAQQNESFDDLFKFEILDNNQALMTIKLFWWQDKEQFYQFTETAFKQLKKHGIGHLIIDIRHNPGGDDDMWKKGLLTYLADQPYRHTSRYTKKIIAKYMDEGETAGDIITKNYDHFEQVTHNNPLAFSGHVSVLIGKVTYSSAILFANTVQDFDFADLIGEESAGYSWQTGGIQFFTFPNSGLKAVSPRFYLERPSGKGKGKSVIPDIYIKDNPLDSREAIIKLAQLNAK